VQARKRDLCVRRKLNAQNSAYSIAAANAPMGPKGYNTETSNQPTSQQTSIISASAHAVQAHTYSCYALACAEKRIQKSCSTKAAPKHLTWQQSAKQQGCQQKQYNALQRGALVPVHKCMQTGLARIMLVLHSTVLTHSTGSM
jgi:hypothetical protein